MSNSSKLPSSASLKATSGSCSAPASPTSSNGADGHDLLRQRARVVLHRLHDVAVAVVAVADEVVVLREHHARAGGEVQRERHVALAEVVLVEHEVLRQVRALAEDQPAEPGIHEPVLVAGDVDRADRLQPEVPGRVRIQERPHEGAAGAVDVHRHLEPALVAQAPQQRVDADDVVGVPGERRAQDGGHADRVLVDVRLDVLGPDRELVRLQRDDPRLDVEVAAELLPHDVHVAAEDEVRPVGRLARGLAARRATSTSG